MGTQYSNYGPDAVIIDPARVRRITGNVTWNNVKVVRGGMLQPASGVTVTINGFAEPPGDFQWVDESLGGTVVFNTPVYNHAWKGDSGGQVFTESQTAPLVVTRKDPRYYGVDLDAPNTTAALEANRQAMQDWLDDTPAGGAINLPENTQGIRIGGDGDALLTLTKPIRMVGGGFWSWLSVDDDVPQTTDVLLVQPNPSLSEIGYGFEAFSIRLASGHDAAIGDEGGRHAIHVDLTTPGRRMAFATFDRLYLFRTGGWSFKVSNGNFDDGFVNTDGFFTSTFSNCRISGGLDLIGCGDSIQIIGGSINGKNGVVVDPVLYANSFLMDRVNFTPRGGLLVKSCTNVRVLGINAEALHADMDLLGDAFLDFAGTDRTSGFGRLINPQLVGGSVVVGGGMPSGNPQEIELVRFDRTLYASIEDVLLGPDTSAPLRITSNSRAPHIGKHIVLGRTPSAAIVNSGTNPRHRVNVSATTSAADSFDRSSVARREGTTAIEDITAKHRLESESTSLTHDFDYVWPEGLVATVKKIIRSVRRTTGGTLDEIVDVLYFAADRLIFPHLAGFSMRDEVAGDQRVICRSSVPASSTHLVGTLCLLRGTTPYVPGAYAKVGSGDPGTWRPAWQRGVGIGPTANRPTLSADDVGVMFLDTTLATGGKPVWWNGSAWKDATGTDV
jgi:hypothetical protein